MKRTVTSVGAVIIAYFAGVGVLEAMQLVCIGLGYTLESIIGAASIVGGILGAGIGFALVRWFLSFSKAPPDVWLRVGWAMCAVGCVEAAGEVLTLSYNEEVNWWVVGSRLSFLLVWVAALISMIGTSLDMPETREQS